MIGGWFLYSEIYTATAQDVDLVVFQIKKDETVGQLADRLEKENVVRSAWFFKKYLVWKGFDKKIQAGEFTATKPITLARVVAAMGVPKINERSITIIPGWNLRNIAEYLEKENIGSQDEFYSLVGYPPGVGNKATIDLKEKYSNIKILENINNLASLEGYLAPETYRIYNDATVEDVVHKLISERDNQLTEEMKADIAKSGQTIGEVITLASIVEREARNPIDMAIVADIFWRRIGINWALQSCATVNYVTGKSSPGVSAEDQQVDSPYNTYKYPGLPPGPISSPSLEAIKATIYPKANDYWYFMTGNEGEMHYAGTLEEHNKNVYKYLR
jgi:UPF0755 protein